MDAWPHNEWVHGLTMDAPCNPQVKEFDTPTTLLANPASMFNKLVEDTGPVASAALRRLAAAEAGTA